MQYLTLVLVPVHAESEDEAKNEALEVLVREIASLSWEDFRKRMIVMEMDRVKNALGVDASAILNG